MKRPEKALVLHRLRASEALWGIRRRTALAARAVHLPELFRQPHDKRLLLYEQGLGVSLERQVEVIVGSVGFRPAQHEALAARLLGRRVHVARPPEELLEARHARLGLGHQPHQELRAHHFHRPQLGFDSWRVILLFSTMSEVAY